MENKDIIKERFKRMLYGTYLNTDILICEPEFKTTRTKLPRKLKKKNKKIGRVNLSVSYVAKTYAKKITVNLGF